MPFYLFLCFITNNIAKSKLNWSIDIILYCKKSSFSMMIFVLNTCVDIKNTIWFVLFGAIYFISSFFFYSRVFYFFDTICLSLVPHLLHYIGSFYYSVRLYTIAVANEKIRKEKKQYWHCTSISCWSSYLSNILMKRTNVYHFKS